MAKALRDRSWEAVLEEMKKCEVVCANCHRRRTAVRAGFARALALSTTSQPVSPKMEHAPAGEV
jgi:hypothetical protein